MRSLGIIPARYASTRFPGKPLADILGKSMIQRVYEQCSKCNSLSSLIVATDSELIQTHVESFGGQAVMTSPDHVSGTDRCQEVSDKYEDYDVIVNIQGDEPMIDPAQIDLILGCFNEEKVEIASLVKEISSVEELFNENSPKVVLNQFSEAIYFSRTPLPHQRESDQNKWLLNSPYFKHLGIYGFRRDTLAKITTLPISNLERTEGLEQLRWLEHGFAIKMAHTKTEGHAVDTPADLEKIIRLLDIR